MEVMKKTVKRIMAVSATTGNDHVIVPDVNVQYGFLIGLTQENHDMGFFDAYVPETGTTSLLGVEAASGSESIITGVRTVPSQTPPVNPTVTTGTAAVGVVKVAIGGNKVNNKGDSIITEYGIIYSDTNSTASNLLYDAAGVVVKSVKADIAIGVSYSQQIPLSGISEDVVYYYRAFARNSSMTGYGTVKNFIWHEAVVKPKVTGPETVV
jgi:hypothetical protein